MDIQAKRVYAPFEQEDGVRILVDRVWPRGVSKEKLHADEWLKEVAPSTQLRKWFNHDRSRWDEFKQRYFAELDAKPQVTDRILKRAPRRAAYPALRGPRYRVQPGGCAERVFNVP